MIGQQDFQIISDQFLIPKIFINTDRLNRCIKNKSILNYLEDILPINSKFVLTIMLYKYFSPNSFQSTEKFLYFYEGGAGIYLFIVYFFNH
jgi:hypothetical protein